MLMHKNRIIGTKMVEKKPGKVVSLPENFAAPPYDQRSSCFVRAGEDHGIGYKQPVGSQKHTPQSPLPKGAYAKETYEKR